MKIVFDIEANGLYKTVDKIWVLSFKDISDPQAETLSYFNVTSTTTSSLAQRRSGTLLEGLAVMYEASEIIGHNIINYDLPTLKKILGWEPNENTKITDTLVMSRLLNPDRVRPAGFTGKGGPHSLACWGYRTSKAKPSHEDWSTFSGAMLRRNREDVEINALVCSELDREIEGWDWSEAIALEHSIAKIITDQEINGVKFDKKRALECTTYLTNRIQEIDDELIPNLPKKVKQQGATVLEPFTKTGAHSKRYREDISYCSGPFTRIEFIPFDLGSPAQVKLYLLDNGWEPDTWNFSPKTKQRTSPKLEGDFRGVDGNLPKKVRKRITLRHRRSQIEGWLANVRDDGRITSGANPCGTNTGRMRHSGVVNVPKANSNDQGLIWELDQQKDFFGTQMRSLFTVPLRHYMLVGHDAKGLELRMLAHYMNDPGFTKEILDGDIHVYNQTMAGLNTRDEAKTFIYAFIYGAGDLKLGDIVGDGKSGGARARRNFLQSLPTLDKLIKSTKKTARAGYLTGLDNRKIWMRSDDRGEVMTHKGLNTLLQCGGSLVMKKSSQILWEELIPKHGIKAYKVIDMHDESQAQVLNKDVELYSELAVKSIRLAGEYYKLNIPMDADVKVGANWAETH